jgi:hypothetical protein
MILPPQDYPQSVKHINGAYLDELDNFGESLTPSRRKKKKKRENSAGS